MQYPEESEEKDQGLVDVPSRNPFRLYAHQGPFQTVVCLRINNYRSTSIGSEVG